MSVILKSWILQKCLAKGSLPLLWVVDEDGVICKSVGCALWAVICTDPVSLLLQRGVALTTRHTEESMCAFLFGEHWEVEQIPREQIEVSKYPIALSFSLARASLSTDHGKGSQWRLYPAPVWGLSAMLLPRFIFLTFSAWPWTSGTTRPFYRMCWVDVPLPL